MIFVAKSFINKAIHSSALLHTLRDEQPELCAQISGEEGGEERM